MYGYYKVGVIMINTFISDLDRTIIHSKSPGYKCVEFNGKKEITYMTEKSYVLLKSLLKKPDFLFVPCTMRDIKKVNRVGIIDAYKCPILICDNGAQIYIYGKLDSFWNKNMREMVPRGEVLNIIEHLINIGIEKTWIRNIDDFYVSIHTGNSNDSVSIYNRIKDDFSDKIDVFVVGSKVFVINKQINKKNAVEYILNKFGIDNYILSGDSLVDKGFTGLGKSILPAHASFCHNSSVITSSKGIYSSEEILEFVKNEFYRKGVY